MMNETKNTAMHLYTVYLVNFRMNKGAFTELEEAVDFARATGFECSIWCDGAHIGDVKPY